MEKEELQKQRGKRYLKKFEIVETDVELPIQGQAAAGQETGTAKTNTSARRN